MDQAKASIWLCLQALLFTSVFFGLRICPRGRDFFSDNLLVRIHLIIEMIRWTGLAPWGFEFLFPGCIASTLAKHRVLSLTPARDEGS